MPLPILASAIWGLVTGLLKQNVNIPALELAIDVMLTGTLYCTGNVPPLNMPPVVKRPPVDMVTVMLIDEDIVPIAVLAVTDDHLAQFKLVVLQRESMAPGVI